VFSFTEAQMEDMQNHFAIGKTLGELDGKLAAAEEMIKMLVDYADETKKLLEEYIGDE
jgi:hypothetical protein